MEQWGVMLKIVTVGQHAFENQPCAMRMLKFILIEAADFQEPQTPPIK
jgi:hypothetical protein